MDNPTSIKRKILAVIFILITVTGSPLPSFAQQQQTPQQEAALAIPAPELQKLAQETLKKLARAYQTRDMVGFMDLVSDKFLSSDGKRKVDLERCLITDFEELNQMKIDFTSFNKRMVTPGAPRQVILVTDWNRYTDVTINFRRKRWVFEGLSEFIFNLETDADLAKLAKESGGKLDYSKIPWELRLVKMRGDVLFGLTDINGLLQVVPAGPGRRSILDNQTVLVPIPIGETAQLTGALRNRTVTLAAAGPGPQSIDFQSGAVATGPAPAISPTTGDMIFGAVPGLFTMLGSARIIQIFSGFDFNSYNQDTTPTNITAPVSVGDIYLVRTQSGRFAKFTVISFPGATVTIKYAFQPNGSGTLVSRD